MAAFSIFTRDSESAEDSRLELQEPSVLSYHRQTASAIGQPLEPLDVVSGLETGLAPEIVLRLPDLASPQPGVLHSLLGLQLFWIAIVLGALLAILLIWGEKKPEPQQIEDIPTWNSPAAWRQEAPVEVDSRNIDQSSVPEIDDRGAPELSPPEIRAARRVDTPWNGNSPPALPGVATPVGTIITGAPE